MAATPAGQAAVFLAETAKHVHLLVRKDGLADTMSRYLVLSNRGASGDHAADANRARGAGRRHGISIASGGAIAGTSADRDA